MQPALQEHNDINQATYMYEATHNVDNKVIMTIHRPTDMTIVYQVAVIVILACWFTGSMMMSYRSPENISTYVHVFNLHIFSALSANQEVVRLFGLENYLLVTPLSKL